jgi:hypothetical protein
VRGRKALIAAGTAAGLVIGGYFDPGASLVLAAGAAILVWIITRVSGPTFVGFGEPTHRVPSPSSGSVGSAHAAPPVPPSIPSPPSDLAGTIELDHLAYADRLVAEADLRGLLDRSSADRLSGLIGERRARVLATILGPPPAAPTTSPPAPAASGTVRNIRAIDTAQPDESTAALDAAIAEAVADATNQAKAAADAAGTQLGEVLDMQVSAMPVVYPMIEAAPQPAVAVGSGSSSGGADPGATGPDAPVRYLGSATVTITWAIG